MWDKGWQGEVAYVCPEKNIIPAGKSPVLIIMSEQWNGDR
jgi:hypothetical protein